MGMRHAIQLSECMSRHQNKGHDHAQASTTKVSTARQSTRRKTVTAFMGQPHDWSGQIVAGGRPMQQCLKSVLQKSSRVRVDFPSKLGSKSANGKRGQKNWRLKRLLKEQGQIELSQCEATPL
jgi:hypothetical protein